MPGPGPQSVRSCFLPPDCSSPVPVLSLQGACYTHAACCSAGTGAFLLLQSTRLLLLRQGRATFAPSLYLDAYGEEDLGLRRGK